MGWFGLEGTLQMMEFHPFHGQGHLPPGGWSDSHPARSCCACFPLLCVFSLKAWCLLGGLGLTGDHHLSVSVFGAGQHILCHVQTNNLSNTHTEWIPHVSYLFLLRLCRAKRLSDKHIELLNV